MKTKRTLKLAAISVFIFCFAICLAACDSSQEKDAEDNGSGFCAKEIAYHLSHIPPDAHRKAIDDTSAKLHERSADKPSKTNSSQSQTGKNTSSSLPQGIPVPRSTRTEDDGSKLVLVNKKYAVSADYYPVDMVAVDGSLSTNQGLYFKREAYDAYLKMLKAAQESGLNFKICSTYRSYQVQTSLYQNSLNQNGLEFTNGRTAYPGRSEHHTGWAVDITSKSMGYGLSQNFINYPEGMWINNHCSEYGFIIRYPQDKTDITGYGYEPWHLRYVGVDVAKEITSRGITLEEYLGKV